MLRQGEWQTGPQYLRHAHHLYSGSATRQIEGHHGTTYGVRARLDLGRFVGPFVNRPKSSTSSILIGNSSAATACINCQYPYLELGPKLGG